MKKIEYAMFKTGPGGWKCPCCNPFGQHPKNMKHKARRTVRRVAKYDLKKIIDQE